MQHLSKAVHGAQIFHRQSRKHLKRPRHGAQIFIMQAAKHLKNPKHGAHISKGSFKVQPTQDQRHLQIMATHDIRASMKTLKHEHRKHGQYLNVKVGQHIRMLKIASSK